MATHRVCLGVAALAMLLSASQAQADVAWDEDLSGDLSDDRLAPTALSFQLGANTVRGSMGGSGPGTDRDYFSFVVPTGAVLTAIQVNPGTAVSGGASFFAIQAGDRITTTPTGGHVEDLLAFGHYGNDAVGTNLLASLLLNPAATLPSGHYAVWTQETGGTVPYSFDFVIAPAPAAVPEPSAALLLAAGLTGLLLLRRRR